MTSSDPERTPMGGRTALTGRGGTALRVEAVYPHLTIVAEPSEGPPARLSLPYPRVGYGGHELLLSPSETYLVLWLYSGQSEVGYELLRFRPQLQHIVSFPYVSGEGVGPVFSPDERSLGRRILRSI